MAKERTYTTAQVDALRNRLIREHAVDRSASNADYYQRGFTVGRLELVNEMRRLLKFESRSEED